METYIEMNRYLTALRSLFLVVTCLFWCHQTLAKRTIDKTVVIVNNDIILESDIDNFLEKIKSKSFQELFGGIDENVLKNRNSALQLLVEEKIIDQQVKKLDLTASESEVDGQIRAILKRNGISRQQLQDRLKQLGATMQEYRDGIRRQIERRNLVEREIKPSLEVTEEQLRHFYMRNARPEDSETQYKIAHILIENKDKDGVKAAERAKRIWADVSNKPENFETFVKDFSDDTSTAESGGLLGSFSPSSLIKEFREAVPKTDVGKVTSPIKTAAGYHIVKILEATTGDFANLSKERKDALRNQMIAVELEKRMAMWLERKKNEAFIKKSLDKDYANQ